MPKYNAGNIKNTSKKGEKNFENSVKKILDIKQVHNEIKLNNLQADLPVSLVENRKFSVYIHIPFCKYRCGYCDFNTYTNTNFGEGAGINDYIDTLCLEYDFALQTLEENDIEVKEIDTVFFGGGTPTFLKATQLSKALEQLSKRIPLAENVEVTTEVNPETVDENYITHLAESGFTRLSFGAQSGVMRILNILDRRHKLEKLAPLIACSKEKGLQTSVDLIYATPSETIQEWEKTLEYAIKLNTDHISAYALMIHEGTKLGQDLRKGKIQAVESDDEAYKYELADQVLNANGFSWYEISNWAKNNKICRHNMTYWKGNNWWGFGCGAHSYVGATRWSNIKHPRKFAKQLLANKSPVSSIDILDKNSVYAEKIMLEIRLKEGIEIDNKYFEFTSEQIDILLERKYICQEKIKQGKIVLSLKGRLMADTVTQILWENFIPKI